MEITNGIWITDVLRDKMSASIKAESLLQKLQFDASGCKLSKSVEYVYSNQTINTCICMHLTFRNSKRLTRDRCFEFKNDFGSEIYWPLAVMDD